MTARRPDGRTNDRGDARANDGPTARRPDGRTDNVRSRGRSR
ncbi:hypothetical protein QUB64_32005 [Microcoleus sp. Aus8_D2]